MSLCLWYKSSGVSCHSCVRPIFLLCVFTLSTEVCLERLHLHHLQVSWRQRASGRELHLTDSLRVTRLWWIVLCQRHHGDAVTASSDSEDGKLTISCRRFFRQVIALHTSSWHLTGSYFPSMLPVRGAARHTLLSAAQVLRVSFCVIGYCIYAFTLS